MRGPYTLTVGFGSVFLCLFLFGGDIELLGGSGGVVVLLFFFVGFVEWLVVGVIIVGNERRNERRDEWGNEQWNDERW